nr:hypothetical protein [Lacticaseibacillus camelliae]
MPTSVIRPRILPGNVKTELAEQPGFIGIGVDLVRFRQEVAPVMENLLGSLIVAETLDAGIKLANLTHHRYRIVTLDGDILTPGGALTGGQTRKQGVSPLARTQEVTQLHAQLRQMKGALAKQADLVNDLQTQLTATQAAATDADRAVNQAQADLAAQKAQLDAQQTSLTQLDRQRQAAKLATGAAGDYDQKNRYAGTAGGRHCPVLARHAGAN